MRGLLIAALMGLAACMPAALRDVPDEPGAPPASPDVLAAFENDPPVTTAADWTERRAPLLRAAFARDVYGDAPFAGPPRVLSRTTLDLAALRDFAIVEQLEIAVLDGDDPLRFNMLLVLPKPARAPAPVLVMEVFCGNRAAVPGRPESVAAPLTPVIYPCTNGWTDPLAEAVLGRQINGPPFERVLARGYAVALFYPGDVVADDAELAPAALARLRPNREEDGPGAIAAYAWLFSRALDILEADTRIDAARTAIWGHSRHGKAALLAAALDTRVDAVIAHQSGRGGASLSRSAQGESIAEITTEYPHWFGTRFARYAPETAPLDQHQLLALIAPRPVLLGNGRNDAWSDPQGAFRAAQGASPVYELFGAPAFDQARLTDSDMRAPLAFFMRPGRHGVTSGDWAYFLNFLDAHVRPAP